MENLQKALTAHPFFTDFPERYLELVEGCASTAQFEPGEFILHEGEDASKFYLIREGKVELTMGSENRGQLSIVTLSEGDILGWSWLFPPYRWRFSARAVEPTRAFVMDGHCLRGKAEQDHDLGYELLKRFSRVSESRLDTMRVQLVKVYEHT
jgi:CRP/FNR family transcriptional regulator, cyclic AMP receptor protein